MARQSLQKGIVDVEVRYTEKVSRLPLVMVKDIENAILPTLFDRDWLSKIKIR